MRRYSRFRDRASYKASEVMALFILSLIFGMICYGLCVLMDFVLQRVFWR